MRSVPIDLQTHLNESVTTTCRLLKFTLTDGSEHGITTLDQDIDYLGVTYYSTQGFDPSLIASDIGFSVDNAEAKALLATEVPGITIEMIKTGQMDDASWTVYVVNWANLAAGHLILDGGDVGEIRIVDDRIVYMPELVSTTMRLRQSIGGVWSRSCRAVFGDPADSQLGCGVDAEVLWQSGTVTGLDDEPDRIFADSALLALDPIPVPGRVQWLTGNNAAELLYQIEGYGDESGTIALLEPCAYPIELGDTFRIRVDCNKQSDTCKDVYDNWLNFKGEPLIPSGDGAQVSTPGAEVAGGFVGSEVIE